MLTDTTCKNAKPEDKPYRKADQKGLYLADLQDERFNDASMDKSMATL